MDHCGLTLENTLHFGFFFHVSPSHASSMAAWGAHLQKRGHRVIAFQVPDIGIAAQRAGLEFCAIGEKQYPLGTLAKLDKKFGHSSGVAGVSYALKRSSQYCQIALEEAPADGLRRACDILESAFHTKRARISRFAATSPSGESIRARD